MWRARIWPSSASLEHRDSLSKLLLKAAKRRSALAKAIESDMPTTAFRWVNGEADGVKGVCVDVYGDHALVHMYEGIAAFDEKAFCEKVFSFGFRGVYVKRRPKSTHKLVDPRDDRWAPTKAVIGVDAPDEFDVFEYGVPYRVRLGDGLGTGLYLDQRNNRRWVSNRSANKKALNLFAYTGAFSMAAAAGGAKDITTVDVSAPALQRAKDSLERHGYAEVHRVVRADVFSYLRLRIKRGDAYDLVVVDPPTHSTVKKQRWTSGKGWVELTELSAKLTAKGGTLLCCSNDQRMSQDSFRKFLQTGLLIAGRQSHRLKDGAPGEDFPRLLEAEGLKSALISL